jgi:ATP-dependent exoDNAse (exonuclease V) beta subunit
MSFSVLNNNDDKARNEALNVEKSFIVEAPAGSGKTTLLVQRFLTLLARVKHPEEIIAITFTRKAAFEMRERIIDALESALTSNANQIEKHKSKLHALAKKALDNCQKHNWNLLKNITRLKIQTIDSLCNSISRQLPILSNLLQEPNILDKVTTDQYYLQAIKNILQSYDHGQLPKNYSESIESILLHLDNDRTKIENLLTSVLEQRDLWLHHFTNLYLIQQNESLKMRNVLESSLKNIALETIKNFFLSTPKDLIGEISDLLNFAQENLIKLNKITSNLQAFDFKELFYYMNLSENANPDLTILENTLSKLKYIAKTFLTEELQWRQNINKKQGFPAKNNGKTKEEKELFADMKQKMEELLSSLAQHENFYTCLVKIAKCPPTHYSDKQWNLINSLLQILPLLVAELKILFAENNNADFTEIALAANQALGTEDSPSELMLNLDYKIKHLLVDEFQDTSITQYRLLEKLTAGWEENDGRTLFLIGDPMQSIYRFRQAEVSLFLRAEEEGIGNVKLIPLKLCVNYRSSKNIIEWTNKIFAKILPEISDINKGAVCFKEAHSANSSFNSNSDVTVYALTNANKTIEYEYAVELIKKIRESTQNESIAILGRSRNHFTNIIEKLKAENISYQALDLETLGGKQIVRDLFALTRALCDLDDVIAWLAILRAPWAGLSLHDLHCFMLLNKSNVFANICEYQQCTNLSPEGKKTIERILPVINYALRNKRYLPLYELIERTWLHLGGPACVEKESDLELTETYFNLLYQNNIASDSLNTELLQKQTEAMYVDQSTTAKNIQIMTIHKAKGLEFDHVLIVGLDHEIRKDQKEIMLWYEQPQCRQKIDLIVAPIQSSDEDFDPIYEYLKDIESDKSIYETGRLLYVAATRAKKSLHLIAQVKNKENGSSELKNPAKSSFLAQLWPSFSSDWIVDRQNKYAELSPQKPELTESDADNALKKLSSDWHLPFVSAEINNITNTNENSFSKEKLDVFTDFGPTKLGTVIHKCLQLLSEDFKNSAFANIQSYITQRKPYWQKILLQNGCINNTDADLQIIIKAINNIYNDPLGQWLFKNHKNADNELPIATIDGCSINHLVIDRTFIDESDQRWIIDYKTSAPTSQNKDYFIEQEFLKYKDQLEQYAKAFSKMEKRKIFLGLYFPLCQRWKQWEFTGSSN